MADIIRDILPEHEVSILAGASGAGKTTLIMHLLKGLLEGGPVLGHDCQTGLRIGYIAADRTWKSYQKTAELVSLDLSKIKTRALVDDPAIDLARFEKSPIDELERLVGTLLPCDLVVVDPLVVFLGVDTNKYHLNAARLIRLNKMCLANKVTLLGTHHATKARSDYSFKRAQDRISGTSALLGFTSTQLFLAAPEETGREDGLSEFHVISHHAPAKVVLLRRGSNGVFELAGEESLQPKPLDERLMEILSNHHEPVTRREIVASLDGFASRAAVDRLLASFVSSGLIEKTDYGLYHLPPAGS